MSLLEFSGSSFEGNFHRRTFALDARACSLRDDGWVWTFVISIGLACSEGTGRQTLAFSLSEWKKVKVCRWVKCMPEDSCVMSRSVLFFRPLKMRALDLSFLSYLTIYIYRLLFKISLCQFLSRIMKRSIFYTAKKSALVDFCQQQKRKRNNLLRLYFRCKLPVYTREISILRYRYFRADIAKFSAR